MSTETKSLAGRLEAVLAENSTCADCPNERPLWASYLRWPTKKDESRMDDSSAQNQEDIYNTDIDIDGALAVVVCNDCAQHHHFELGKKRCLIKYLKYSHELNAKDLDILEHSGNDLVNEFYEAHLWGSFQKTLVLGDVEAEAARRGKFIKEKYKKCLYRDHAGLANAVQQALSMQEYANNNATVSSSHRRSSQIKESKDSKKQNDKITAAVRTIRRTQSIDSDARRRRSSTSDVRASSKQPMRKAASLDMETTDQEEEEEEDETPKYNPTGKTYTDEFNLEAAKTKEEEKAILLNELIEKAVSDDDTTVGGDTDDDTDNKSTGWGLNNLKVLKGLGKTAVRSKPARERGVTVATSNDKASDLKRHRASTLEMHMQIQSDSKRNLNRTHSVDESVESSGRFNPYRNNPEQEAQLDHLQQKMMEVQSALQLTKNVAESLKKSAGMEMDVSVKSAGGRRGPPQRGVLRRNSSLSDLDKLRKSGTSEEPASTSGTAARRGGRKKHQSTKKVAEPVKKSAGMEAASVKSAEGRKGPPQRGVLRRNSSLSDLDKLRTSGTLEEPASTSGTARRGGRKKNAADARRIKKPQGRDESTSSGRQRSPKGRERSGSTSPRSRRKGDASINRKDAKSVASMSVKSSSGEQRAGGSRSPRRRDRTNMPAMHKSLGGLSGCDDSSLKGIDDLRQNLKIGVAGSTKLKKPEGIKRNLSAQNSSIPTKYKDAALSDETKARDAAATALKKPEGIRRNMTAPNSSIPIKTKDSTARSLRESTNAKYAGLKGNLTVPPSSDHPKSKDSGVKFTSSTKSRSKSPKRDMTVHKSMSGLDDNVSFLQTLQDSITKGEASSPKTSKTKNGSRSPKKDTTTAWMSKSANGIDQEMLNNLSDTISRVRTLVGPSENELASSTRSKGSAPRKDRIKRGSVSVAKVAESSCNPDASKLDDAMTKMKQFKTRNERAGNGAKTKRDRLRSSLSDSFSELMVESSADPSSVNRMLAKTLKGKKGKDKTKKESSGERGARRRSNSLNDLKSVRTSPEKTAERVFLRQHLNAMLDDSSGSAI